MSHILRLFYFFFLSKYELQLVHHLWFALKNFAIEFESHNWHKVHNNWIMLMHNQKLNWNARPTISSKFNHRKMNVIMTEKKMSLCVFLSSSFIHHIFTMPQRQFNFKLMTIRLKHMGCTGLFYVDGRRIQVYLFRCEFSRVSKKRITF